MPPPLLPAGSGYPQQEARVVRPTTETERCPAGSPAAAPPLRRPRRRRQSRPRYRWATGTAAGRWMWPAGA